MTATQLGLVEGLRQHKKDVEEMETEIVRLTDALLAIANGDSLNAKFIARRAIATGLARRMLDHG
jgi:hypothetical protein